MKNSIFKTLLILIFTIGSYLSTNASHLLGGEITWECANNGDYIFTLTLYQDCNGNQILVPQKPLITQREQI